MEVVGAEQPVDSLLAGRFQIQFAAGVGVVLPVDAGVAQDAAGGVAGRHGVAAARVELLVAIGALGAADEGQVDVRRERVVDAAADGVDLAPELHRKVDTIRSRIDYTLTPDIDLSFVGGTQRTDGNEQFDARGGYTVPTSDTTGGILRNTRIDWEHYTNASGELNLKSSGKKTVDWLLGAYYFHERAAIRLDQPAYSGTQEGYGCTTCGWPSLTSNSFVQPAESVKSSALFTQDVWNVSDRFRMTGGLRETWDQKRNNGGVNYYCPTTQPNGTACEPISASDNPADVGRGYRLAGRAVRLRGRAVVVDAAVVAFLVPGFAQAAGHAEAVRHIPHVLREQRRGLHRFGRLDEAVRGQ